MFLNKFTTLDAQRNSTFSGDDLVNFGDRCPYDESNLQILKK